MAANMWKNSLNNVESDNNKIIYETLLDFLQQNGTYFLNKPRSTQEFFVAKYQNEELCSQAVGNFMSLVLK